MKLFKIYAQPTDLLRDYYFCIVAADNEQDAISMVESHRVIVDSVEEIKDRGIVYHDHGYY
jgi:hypothetical protein